jgi:hypothetical protein
LPSWQETESPVTASMMFEVWFSGSISDMSSQKDYRLWGWRFMRAHICDWAQQTQWFISRVDEFA